VGRAEREREREREREGREERGLMQRAASAAVFGCMMALFIISLMSATPTEGKSQSPSGTRTPSVTPSTSVKPRKVVWNGLNITTFLRETVKKNNLVGAALTVIKNRRVAEGFPFFEGKKNFTRKRGPVDADTQFLVSGLAKPIVALLLGERISSLELSLDDPISPWLDLAEISVINPLFIFSDISFRNLLAHKTAIRDRWDVIYKSYVNSPSVPYTLPGWLQEYFRSELNSKVAGKFYSPNNFFPFGPGDSRNHSNYAVGLMAAIVEVINILISEKIDSLIEEKMKKEMIDDKGKPFLLDYNELC